VFLKLKTFYTFIDDKQGTNSCLWLFKQLFSDFFGCLSGVQESFIVVLGGFSIEENTGKMPLSADFCRRENEKRKGLNISFPSKYHV